MRSYLISTGWQTLFSQDDYTREERSTAQWGVRDDITFSTVATTIERKSPDTSLLVGYSTLSSHEPWDVPTHNLDNEVDNAFDYLDNCIYNFVERLRAKSAWDNLLIIITADHGINHGNVSPATPLEKNHIPMLWLGGAIRKPITIDKLCNQSDLCATLLAQMQLPHKEFTFSRDVLSEAYTHPTAVNNFNNAQWLIDSTGHALFDFDAHRFTICHTNDSLALLTLNKAILQVTTSDLSGR